MPLIRLEVDNFKSYKGKQTIGPFHAFTAVIGPNGSGKSNLMDALSFVLGVRSAQLRSSQLKDLIYRGEAEAEEDQDEENEEGEEEASSKATKASVTAVYQDRDETEYHFKRSVTATGASEYRVNNRVLSASAYNDRLKQFNILVKAKNFLVFQGDVEAVASQSPKELSRLVDQVSGSLEYKEAYEAAKVAQERALENQKHTIFKRKGMNTDLNFYKGQKNEAERFKRLQKERDDYVLHEVLWKLFHMDKKIQEDTKNVEKSSSKIPALKKELIEQERNVKKRRNERALAQEKVNEEAKSIRKQEKQLEKQQPDLDAIDEKLRFVQDKLSNAEKLRKSVEPEVAKYKASIAKYESDYATAKEAADRAAQEQASASAARGFSLNEQDLARYHELKSEANVRAVAERQKLETLSRDIKTKRNSLQSLQDKLSEAQKQKEKLEAEVEILKERKIEGEQKRNEAQQVLVRLRSEREEAERKKSAIKEQEEKLNATLATCLTKLSEANNVQMEREKEKQKREQVATLRQKCPGVHGRLADLCQPTQSKYDLAISTILGRNADAIVVETQRDAIECIDHLKFYRKGQATFIPLDTAQVKEINERLRSISTGARLAFDVIQFDEKVKRAMQYACGNALVCDSLRIARMLCYEKNANTKVVTLDGTVIHKSGLISGGLSGDASTQRWEDREIEGLKRQRDQCLAELKELGKDRYEVSQQGNVTLQVNKAEASLAISSDELSKVETRLTGMQDEIRVLDRQVTQLTPRVDSAQKELDESIRQTRSLKQTVDAEDDAVFASFCRRIGVQNIREYEERQLKLMQQQSDARAMYEQQMKRLEISTNFDKAQLQREQSRLELCIQTIASRTEDVKKLKSERVKLRAALDAVISEIDEKKQTLKEMQKAEAKASELLKKSLEDAKLAQSKLDTNAKEVASLTMELDLLATDRLKLYRRCRLEEIDLPLQSGSKKLNVAPLEEQVSLTGPEFNSQEDDSMDLDSDGNQGRSSLLVADYGIKVDFSRLSKAEKQDSSEDMGRTLESKIEVAASELDKMTPNVRANDRMIDTENRLAEVDGEFEKARKEAKKAQDEYLRLKKIRCDLFNKAFDHISSKIDQIYKELTKSKTSPKGGSAYLVLENSEEPYLAGLQFSAIPPAKTFRGIDHLSGGEKTMAAVALLFAIQSVFPAPFIVLDEVDAALDSINVQRVADYIRSRASNDLQFIVISHKASLYERSSALVGVMRNQAISSSATLTLDLEQYA